MERAELAAWLRLTETAGIGNETARKLLATFGSPQAVFEQPARALAHVLGPALVQAVLEPPPQLETLIENTWQWLQAHPDRHLITLGDPAYPAALLEAPQPPLMLSAVGHLALLQRPALAVVGSRNPTAQGSDNARAFAAELSRAGLTVVSGLALGIDGAAHEGALQSREGQEGQGRGGTIAVVGTGLDRVYPKSHRELAHRIAEQGLLISEFALGTPPLADHFPRRNRIIAALGRGTLVVEAALQSGSLITARLAAEQGREVFAIPGSIHSPQSRGCHWLIKQGAKLVETARDILDELQWRADGPAPASMSASAPDSESPAVPDAQDDPVLDALGFDPASLDALIARTGRPAAELSARLLELEFEGTVARLPGQLFQRLGRA